MADRRPTEFVEMGDAEIEEFEAAIADPSTIKTHERACEIIGILDHEIADIEAQLDVARVEASVTPPSPEKQSWVRRAAYAAAIKRNQRHRVMQRDKEIRGTKMVSQARDPAEGIIRQMRAKAEAEARKIAKQNEHIKHQHKAAELAHARSVAKQFVIVANEVLDCETYDALMARAKDRSAAMKEHAQ